MTLEPVFVEEMHQNWLPGAMYPSEILWLYDQIVLHRVEVLIECGRQDGVSTRGLGTMLAPHGVKIFSIDFDEDGERLAKVKQSLVGLDVECVSGDIHRHVPLLVEQNRGKRIAVVQDGPKGWEGLSTLLACVFNEDVVLVAQHNLHVGHRSRAFFSLLACNPPFLEYDPQAVLAQATRQHELGDARYAGSNREVDHSSLGICSLEGPLREAVKVNLGEIDKLMGPWSAFKTEAAWRTRNFDHVSILRKSLPRRLYRFKAR
jgi:hypothetical protein